MNLRYIVVLLVIAMAGPFAVFSSVRRATSYGAEGFMKRLRLNRDVVLVDQRGTGKSNPLTCAPIGSREDMRGYFGEVFAPAWLKACRAELEKIANLKLYTSSIAMDDLDASSVYDSAVRVERGEQVAS